MNALPSSELTEARDLIERFIGVGSSLRGPEVASALREAVRKAERRWALYLLLVVDADLVREVLRELIVAALRRRDAFQVGTVRLITATP